MPITDNTLQATLDISSLNTNIPHSEGMDVVCVNAKYTMGQNLQFPEPVKGINTTHFRREFFQICWKTIRTNSRHRNGN